jgi:ATP-dependent Lhr-like helicase
MLELVSEGCQPAESYSPDLSVVVQQVLSRLYASPTGLTQARLAELLSPLCSEIELEQILYHLRTEEWLTVSAGESFGTTKLRDLGDKGRIHSNISDPADVVVRDSVSGREVGRVRGEVDGVFMLARKAWKVEAVADGLISVHPFQPARSP